MNAGTWQMPRQARLDAQTLSSGLTHKTQKGKNEDKQIFGSGFRSVPGYESRAQGAPVNMDEVPAGYKDIEYNQDPRQKQ